MVGEHVLYNFNFLKVCFVVQDILVNVPGVLEKNTYSFVIGWSVLQMSIRSFWLMILLSFSICLMIFCLVVLQIVEWVAKVSNYNCGFLYLFSSISFCFIYFPILLFGAYILRTLSLIGFQSLLGCLPDIFFLGIQPFPALQRPA